MIRISNLNHIEVTTEVSRIHGGDSNSIEVKQTANAIVKKTDFGIAIAKNVSIIKAEQSNARVKIISFW